MNPPRGDAESRRAVILDAALRVFGQYGHRRTCMDDIAREAGIARLRITCSADSTSVAPADSPNNTVRDAGTPRSSRLW
jgi:hypothetical protein